MKMPPQSTAFGAPWIAPRWTSSARDGIGTAYHSTSRILVTLSHGIVNKISLVFFMQTRLAVRDENLRGKLRLYALLVPGAGYGKNQL